VEKDSGFRVQESAWNAILSKEGEVIGTGLTPDSCLLSPALIIGYGNPYRRDDGVAWHVINALRARLGRPPLALDDTGEDNLGHAVDTVMAHQLVPEVALLLPPYSRVIFVDAHIGEIPVPLRVIEVEPGGEFQATTHHFGPGMLLSLAQAQSGTSPRGWLVSIRGDDFNYGETLTETCASQVEPAVDEIMRLADTN
jgi:hydrogenase maturation protease